MNKHSNVTTFVYALVIKETGSKVSWFAGFCHHPVMITSVHTHVYRYPLFESGTKTDP